MAASRKDFVAIAEAIKNAAAEDKSKTTETIAREIANHFTRECASFDRNRFLTACGID